MLLNELLRPELIKIGLEAHNKEEAISELIDLLVQEHEIAMKHRQSVLEDVFANENDLGTGMENGIAVPHTTTDHTEDIICAVGTSAKGIPFQNLDGELTRLVVLVLAPKRNFAGEIRTLVGIQNILANETLRGQIIQATDANSVYNLLITEEPSV